MLKKQRFAHTLSGGMGLCEEKLASWRSISYRQSEWLGVQISAGLSCRTTENCGIT